MVSTDLHKACRISFNFLSMHWPSDNLNCLAWAIILYGPLPEYNKIPLYPLQTSRINMSFIKESNLYYCTIMPFSLNNVLATY